MQAAAAAPQPPSFPHGNSWAFTRAPKRAARTRAHITCQRLQLGAAHAGAAGAR